MAPLEIFALAVLLAWIGLHLDRRRAWPSEMTLPATAETPADGWPRVVALVPARDEAAVLPQTLPSLLAQETPPLEVLLLDDGSRDGTAEVARELAAAAGRRERLRVLAPGPVPAGWSGKVHALARGLESLGEGTPEWLLFSDADIRHRPGSVAALLARAAAGPYDLVSVMARLNAESFWEKLLIPPFVFFFQLLYPFRRAADPRSHVAAAAGGCVLVRREALAAAGGLAAIRGAVIDDVSLARRVKDAGGRLWLGFDPEIVSVRPYRGLGEIWRMVARSAFVGLGFRYDLLVLVTVWIATFLVAPPFLLAAALAGGDTRAALWAALAWLLGAAALWPAVRHHRVPSLWALTLPFASALYGLMTLDSAWNHLRGHGARWKGRSYGGEPATSSRSIAE